MARILIADDALFMRKIIGNMVRKNGHEVVGEAVNGRDAVKKYEELKPDAVFMDITMPGMKGIDALKKIKAMDDDARIIICSALGMQYMITDAIVGGARDFIVKPFSEAKLMEVLEKALKN